MKKKIRLLVNLLLIPPAGLETESNVTSLWKSPFLAMSEVAHVTVYQLS